MAFHGCEFVFNGVSSFEYGLMIYDIGGASENGKFASGVSISEDRTSRRYTPLHYGTTQNNALTFTMTFGADINSLDKYEYLDRWEMDAIATWLTGYDEYKWLEVIQPDLDVVRYKCIITNLEYTTYGNKPWAFTCEVTCDSPFAYTQPETFTYAASGGGSSGVLESRSAPRFYYPKVTIDISSGRSVTIRNKSDGDRAVKFENLPSSVNKIIMDNENEIITNNDSVNIYDCFNFNFFRLVRGRNDLYFQTNGTVTIECEFPINVGG